MFEMIIKAALLALSERLDSLSEVPINDPKGREVESLAEGILALHEVLKSTKE
jgi:hypothetical protein